MSEPNGSNALDKNSEEYQQKKRQVWTIAIVMMVSTCLGTSVLLFLFWFIVKKIIPAGGF